jgi:N-acetylmuramoyl-L-alanine amidase
MVALDDLSTLFQLTVREDAAARAVTVSYKNQTIVLTPDQSLASMGGRLISMPAPLVRQGRRWMVPIEFIGRALASIYDTRLDLRPASRLLVVGDLRVPHVTVQYADLAPGLRVTLDLTPRAATTITQDQTRLLVRVDADALDPSLAPPPAQNNLATTVRAVEPNTIEIDLGPRFASYRAATPTSVGASVQMSVDLLPAAAESSSAAPAAPAPPAASADLPVFGVAPRPTIRTIVIDAGHGGDDNGVKGPGGTLEKNVVLEVAKRVKTVIETRLGVRVILTRDGDTSVTADARAAIANNNKADALISLHANGSLREATKGTEVYYFSLDRFGDEAHRQSVGEREVLPVYGGSPRDFSLVDWDLAQASHIEDSSAFAKLIEEKLRAGANLTITSVRKAEARPLAGANMPAVLIELGYLSNPDEEKRLRLPDFQSNVAQAISDAVIAFRDYLERPAHQPGQGAPSVPTAATTPAAPAVPATR